MNDSARAKLRPIAVWLHRSLALAAGLFICVLGLSGSAAVFTATFMRWEAGNALFPPPSVGTPASFERLVAAAKTSFPELQPRAIISPGAGSIKTNAAMVIGLQPLDDDGGRLAYYIVGLDAVSGRVLGHLVLERSWALLPIYMHTQLLLPDEDLAHTLMGVLALVLIVLLCSGSVLWWPIGRLGQGLGWRRDLPSPACWRERHKTVAIYVAPLLLVLAVSGLILARPQWAAGVLSPFTAVRNIDPGEYRSSPAGTCGAPLTETQVFQIAHRRHPQTRFGLLAHPQEAGGAYLVTLKSENDIRMMGDIWVVVDAECPRILAERVGSRGSFGDAVNAWAKPIHGGRELPAFIKALVVIAGLAPTFLFVTGLVFRRRRRSR